MPNRVATATGVQVAGRRPLRLSLWWPEPLTGADRGLPPLPAIGFAHGYLAPASAYAGTLADLASHGFVVVAVESERGLVPRHAALAEDLSRALEWLTSGAEGVRGLHDAVDADRLGLLGHSMGGGCAVLAAAADPRVRSLSTMAAALTHPSSAEAAGRLAVPTQFLAAERDAVTPPGRHQRPMFEAVPDGVPAQLGTIRGGSHSGFVDGLWPWDGSPLSGPRLPPATQRALARELVVEWFRLTLGGDRRLWDRVWGPAAHDRPDVALETRSATARGLGGAWPRDRWP